jgi:hypothetical protein
MDVFAFIRLNHYNKHERYGWGDWVLGFFSFSFSFSVLFLYLRLFACFHKRANAVCRKVFLKSKFVQTVMSGIPVHSTYVPSNL